MKRIERLLNVVMGASFGSWLGLTIGDYRYYRIMEPFNSAPWYTPALVRLIPCAAVILACLLLKLWLRRRAR